MKRKMTTLTYWQRPLKEANIETHEVERMVMDRAKWKNVVKDRMRHRAIRETTEASV